MVNCGRHEQILADPREPHTANQWGNGDRRDFLNSLPGAAHQRISRRHPQLSLQQSLTCIVATFRI